jgi:serine/threonine-protein kinase SRPK3
MVSLLGPPPLEFLKRSEKYQQYWDSRGIASKSSPAHLEKKTSLKDIFKSSPANSLLSVGHWRGFISIPDQSFETRERRLNDDNQALLLRFVRRALRWIPEERPVAEELAFDDFLMQPQVVS